MTEQIQPTLGDLPEGVRTRVVGLTADVLPSVVRLPASLRRVATFAPARRAKLGGGAIAEALEADDDFRERVATQLSARIAPDLDVPSAETAAFAWLVRPDGWELVVKRAAAQLADAEVATRVDQGELDRLRDRAVEAEQAVRDLRQRHRAQVEEYKSENASLRRKLGESRVTEKTAKAELDAALKDLDELRAAADAATSAQEKEVRRLRAQVAQLESEATAERRTARSERDDATLRARLLLDTVIDAASGLRRELGLPAVSGAPGDRVESEVESATAARTPSGTQAPMSAAVLEQLLAMPRARLIVDGYNVSKSAWPSSSLEAQRIRLVNALAPLVARTGAETTVVFDAAASTARPVVNVPRGIKVLFSPEGVIADDVIHDLVEAEPAGRVIVVASSDGEVASHARRAGARTVEALRLADLLGR
ncbi:putative RNA-binding protein with PIN domain/regulator of replication initiation timing [Nocardioides ginsengisegetis]|uniref:Putative RNA-binding protein with PIN domain/regulator of replication initiation timing n=1 Tax=Nocardioides ginsengisegetis TaxID=661491 RepID=A0A7W3PA02_9ACTN|nr:putative RNA-binding protein with PIN domain/regulator of replication initiation timing [Nocardioides ginsengisegetis]